MNSTKSLLLVLLMLAAPLALAGCNANAQDVSQKTVGTQAAGQTGTTRTVEAVTVTSEPFTRTISAVGTAYPVQESRIAASVGGTVTSVYVKEGDHVKKGDALLGIDNRSFKLGVEQARAQLKAAEVQADLMRIEFERMEKLKGSNAVSQSNYDQMKARHEAAVSQLAMAKVGLKQAKKALSDTTLRAPYDGIIAGMLIEKGEFASSMPPAPLVYMIDNSSLEVKTFIPEDNARDITVGQKAEVTIESAGVTVEGSVVFVSDRIQEATRTFEVYVRLENPEAKIKAGAYAKVTILAATTDNATVLPTRSIVRDSSGKPFVYTATNGKVKRMFLRITESAGQRTVVEGLEAGSVIITTDLDDLNEGEIVTVKDQG